MQFGVIPTNGRDCVDRAVEALRPQVDRLAIVEGGDPVTKREYPENVDVLQGGAELNISHWWNTGIDWAADIAKEAGAEKWDVAVINDDVIVPPTWLCYITQDLRALGAVAGCTGGRNHAPEIQRAARAISLWQRIQGFAYVIAGETGLRIDEGMKWWFSDDDLGATAATMGGMVMMPGCHVTHLHPGGQTTVDHQPQIGRDRDYFIAKWGFVPW